MLRGRWAWNLRACAPTAYRTHVSGPSKYVMSAYERYGDWTRSQLLRRIAQLESSVSSAGVPSPEPERPLSHDPPGQKPKAKKPRPFDVSAQPARKIALRFCYDGSQYSGLAAQTQQATPLPTVEETLWEALGIARLVDPSKGMDGAGWSRCGRTDAGVSAAGQVVALWVRSRCVDERPLRDSDGGEAIRLSDEDELPYVATLNRLLPPTIRVQAWSPVAPGFSARFDCTYRHYKYFFTLGAPASLVWQPESTSQFPQRLDIDRMRDAVARLIGEHDFRNLCKVDASKQITNFVRRIDGATIDPVPHGWPTVYDTPESMHVTPTAEPMYVLNLRGSAFLYHQVRNIMAVLFMVGARLEEPSIVDALVNVYPGAAAQDRQATRATLAHEMHNAHPLHTLPDPSETLSVIETKPSFEMSADRPLMLWECGFRSEDVQWRACASDAWERVQSPHIDFTPTLRATANLHAQWTREAIHAELLRHFVLASASSNYTTIPTQTSFDAARSPCLPAPSAETHPPKRAQLVPLGNGSVRPTTKYTPMVQRPRDVSAHEKNEKWRLGKGRRRAERRAEALSDNPDDSLT